MKKIALYFGDVFWCTTPYVGVALFYELSKNHEVFPLFMRNDIRLHKKWRGDEKFWFDVQVFKDLPFIESENLPQTVKELDVDFFITSAQMQFKGHYAARNRAIRELGIPVALWDVGGADALCCTSSFAGWDYFFSKGPEWKKHMVDPDALKKEVELRGMSFDITGEAASQIFSTGCLDYDELSAEYDFKIRISELTKGDFCSKYGLDATLPILAYNPANPCGDNSWVYPSSGLTAREAFNDINSTLRDLQNNYGYQVCLKSHPNDYISSESQNEYHGLHPRAPRGGYSTPRYESEGFNNFTTIEAQDGYNLYRNSEVGVTNYSHSGFELLYCRRKCFSYRMSECPEWPFVGELPHLTYLDVNNGEELKDGIINYTPSSFSVPDSVISQYLGRLDGSAYKRIAEEASCLLKK